MSTQDINAGKPQREWVLSAGTVIPLYGKKYMITISLGDECVDCAFFDENATEARMCVNSLECASEYREAVGGDSVHFVEVD